MVQSENKCIRAIGDRNRHTNKETHSQICKDKNIKEDNKIFLTKRHPTLHVTSLPSVYRKAPSHRIATTMRTLIMKKS